MTKQNFLLGKGERLTERVSVKSGGPPKEATYTFEEVRARLKPMLAEVTKSLNALPDAACPDDNAVATVTLNPDYIAKSYFPTKLLRAVGLRSVGSRRRRITPLKRSGGRAVKETPTTEMFLMGTRSAFQQWARDIGSWQSGRDGADQLVTIETISVPAPTDKLIHVDASSEKKKGVFEVILHADERQGEESVVGAFKDYLASLGIDASLERRFYAGGLCFLEVTAPAKRAKDMAAFSLVRAIRPMPPLRMLRPAIRTAGVTKDAAILPTEGPLDPNLRVAIFDGGIPAQHPITKWAKPIDAPGVGPEDDELLRHGVGVTSALLFGHLLPNKLAPRPFANVDHYRVIDTVPGQNPYELYEILDRIENVLAGEKYQFVNFSLGPELPIDDDEVHAWTAVLDEYFSRGHALAVIAVGNGGEGDAAIAANRIQVPSDCVNTLAVGAADSPDSGWARASYSSVGPGRSPGLIKPDLVAFGGSTARPFLVLRAKDAPRLEPTGGTSFSAPSTLRMGIGVRAHFGASLSPLAIRALLIHATEPAKIPHAEIGWGRLAANVQDIVVCPDGAVRIVYQGKVTASKYVRARIPVPDVAFKGMVAITATLCYATAVDPHHPGNYTRAGLEVAFRPNKDVFRTDDAEHASTKSFFGKNRPKSTEQTLRQDGRKWENCQHATVRCQGRSLNGPVFDIHYNARAEGHDDSRSQELEYALIVSVNAKRMPDLYDRIVRAYRNQLETLRPVVEVPIGLETNGDDT